MSSFLADPGANHLLHIDVVQMARGYLDPLGIHRHYVVFTRLADHTYLVADPAANDTPVGQPFSDTDVDA